jgi:cell division protein FtsL
MKMATNSKAYKTEYSYKFEPEIQPERIKRTRQRPEKKRKAAEPKHEKHSQGGTLSSRSLRVLVTTSFAIGILLIGIVLINAQAAKFQYSINQLRNENKILESEISMLALKIDTSAGISQLEAFATEELGMHYPQGSECIYLSNVSESDGSLSELIRQKAYE